MSTDEPLTCGRGVAAQAVVPRAFGDVLGAVAHVLETHIPALDLTDDLSRAERDAYVEIVASHRALAEQLRLLVERMQSLQDLPMGRHDATQMAGPEPVAAFEGVVRAERELLELLQGREQWNAAMLTVMHAGGQADGAHRAMTLPTDNRTKNP
jgi:hypothetical protein